MRIKLGKAVVRCLVDAESFRDEARQLQKGPAHAKANAIADEYESIAHQLANLQENLNLLKDSEECFGEMAR